MMQRGCAFVFAVAVCGWAAQALAQQTSEGTTASETQNPLSEIDWMKSVLHTPSPATPTQPQQTTEPQVATSAAIADVTVTPLGGNTAPTIGLLPATVTGLPKDLWQASNSARLSGLIEQIGVPQFPAIQDLMRLLILAEAAAPTDASTDQVFLLARIDALVRMGSLEAAFALAARAQPVTPQVFQRRMDIGLLTGQEQALCDLWRDTPGLRPQTDLRVFCLARQQDWVAASLTLDTAKALDQITPVDARLLAAFLDPEMEQTEPPKIASHQLTPLQFRVLEAIGHPRPTRGLPLPYAASDLRQNSGWKARLEAAERLGRSGALPDNQFLGIFTEKTPSASGQIWDRVEAIQRLEAAVRARDPSAVNTHLPPAMDILEPAGLLVPVARLFAETLGGLPLGPTAKSAALRLGYLSPAYETIAIEDPAPSFRKSLAQGTPQDATATTAVERAIVAGFTTPPAARAAAMIKDGHLGQAILTAVLAIEPAGDGDITGLAAGLSVLRAVGLEDYARRTALQVLLL
ncbi:hypothetical protein [Algirhabdus cladophorae]|uniref:hypothetical protein n=1 Tax=Algirhabdus cladophorae TaxID=3377108 RepID=UPI003B84B099